MSDNAFAGWGGTRATTNGDNEITFTNVRILDATGEAPYAGDVTVESNAACDARGLVLGTAVIAVAIAS